MINKFISLIFCQIFLSLGFISYSQTADATYLFGVFNGVFTTKQVASDTTIKIRGLRDKSGGEFFANESVEYHSFYNTSGSEVDGMTRLDDLSETFQQLSAQFDKSGLFESRVNLFWEMVNKLTDGSVKGKSEIAKLNKSIPGFSGLYNKFIRDTDEKFNSVEAQKLQYAQIAALTDSDYQIHNDYILANKDKKMMFVGHSQGNLFMNHAFEYATNTLKISEQSIKVLHIAPPTTVLHGDYYLNKHDLVIGILTILGIKPNNIAVGKYFDTSGHGFLEVYYNADTKTASTNDPTIDPLGSQNIQDTYTGPSTLSIVNAALDKLMGLLVAPA